jgi:hypothetical protein
MMFDLEIHGGAPFLKRKREESLDLDPFEKTVSKVRLLERMPTEKGVNETARFLVEGGRKIGVIKSHLSLNQEPFFRRVRLALGQGRLLNYDAEIYNEYVGSRLSSFFNFKMAPQAKMVGQNEVVIEFLEGYRDLKSLQHFIERETFSEKEIELWQLMSLYNFILGNLDPHSENIFVKIDAENHLVDIKMIDFGNSMIQSNPEFRGLEGYQGAWGQFNIANIPFTPKVKEFVQTLSLAKLDQFIEEIAKDRPTYWTPKMKTLLRERMQLVVEHLPESPTALSKIHTQADFDTFLHPEKKSWAQAFNVPINLVIPKLHLGIRNLKFLNWEDSFSFHL